MESLTHCPLCNSSDFVTASAEIRLCRCRACGFVFDNPRPSREEIARYYSGEQKYDAWLAAEEGRDRMWRNRLKLVRRLKPSGDLLDVGTGIGQFLKWASDHYRVTGTEVSDSAILTAKEKYGLEVLKGAIEDVDFGTRRFDLITIIHVLEHVHDPNAVVDKCLALLKPDGALVIAVPNELHSVARRVLKFVLARLGMRKFKRYGTYGLPKVTLDGSLAEIHLLHFTDTTLRRWLKSKGLRILQESLDPYFVDAGLMRWGHRLYYYGMLVLQKITGKNLYDTLWFAVTPE